MFTEAPFLERFEKAAKAGFTAVEYLLPYAFVTEEVAVPLARHNLTQVLFNMPAGNWDKGERWLAAVPGREDEFVASLEKALAYAKATNPHAPLHGRVSPKGRGYGRRGTHLYGQPDQSS